MKVYTLSGKSGTGKSYQAVSLCRKMNIEAIIDDGLFVHKNKVIAGVSAKRQKTKLSAVKTAIFYDENDAKTVREAVHRVNPKSILILGTSDDMVDMIIEKLDLPKPIQRVYIEDITTEDERKIATKQRNERGEHVIPAPTFQIKRQFSGYFMSPMKLIRDWGPWRDGYEKSVVRPTYSYHGKYNISEKVMADIIECIKDESQSVYEIIKVTIREHKEVNNEGIEVYVVANLNYMDRLYIEAEKFQDAVAKTIEDMTAFNVLRVDLEIRALAG
ncbi:MAG: hypothetical protein Q4B78_04310 [Bacillota bacterium]|nr:hypothetical protein [Bacillota bacterium]